MAKLGIPEASGFWVGGKTGRLLHGDVGAIAARIERVTMSTRALRLEIDGMATLLASDAAPTGAASGVLRSRIADATEALTILDEAALATVAEMVKAT
jgi:hypothetical protein